MNIIFFQNNSFSKYVWAFAIQRPFAHEVYVETYCNKFIILKEVYYMFYIF